MRTPDLRVTVHQAGIADVLRYCGEVDLANVEQFLQHLREATRAGRAVIVDLRELFYIDIRGIEALEQVSDEARGADRRLIIASASPMLRKMLGILELEGRLESADTVEEALRRIREPGG